MTRYPDQVVVAEALTEPAFSEKIDAPLDYFSYGVVAFTADGAGPELQSEGVLVGAAFEVPYYTAFEDQQEANRWIIWDANNDGYKFSYSDWNLDSRGLQIETTSNPANDYALSPNLKLKGNATYRITLEVYFQNYWSEEYYPNHMHDLAISAGMGQEGQKDVKLFEDVKTLKGYTTLPFEANFVPEKDGVYNVGLHVLSSVNDYLVLRSAKVEEVLNKDLAAVSLDGMKEVAVGAASEFKVVVENKGAEDVDNFKVKVVRLDGADKVVLGEKNFKQTIKSNESVEVTLEATPDQEGELILAALVELEGDEDTANNLSTEFVVNADPEGTIPFNRTIGEQEAENTDLPMGFYRTHSLSQSIYLGSEIALDKDVTVSRIAFAYNGQEAVNEEFNVEIFMAMTNNSEKTSEEDWVNVDDMTLVYAGKKTVQLGTDLLLSFNLDTPFKLEAGKNLLISVRKEGIGKKGFYPALFKQYNKDWEGPMRSVSFQGTQHYNFDGGKGCKIFPLVPVLHMAIEDLTGIEQEIVLGKGIWFDADNSRLVLDGVDAATMAVYDLSGRLLLNQEVAAGASNVQVDLAEGLYIVKVIDRDGKAYTAKIHVER